jgi:hypothetical protein
VQLIDRVEDEDRAIQVAHVGHRAMEQLARLLPNRQVLRRPVRFGPLRQGIAEKFPAPSERSAGMHGGVPRDLEQEAPLGAWPHVGESSGRNDEGPLNLVLNI